MKKISLTATRSERADRFIAAALGGEGITRSRVKKLMDEGLITVGGEVRPASYVLKLGDEISVELPEPKELDAAPQNIPLNIVYEDEDVLVVNKPRGLVVHPAAGNEDGTLVNAVLYHCGGSLSAINGVIRPGIVHRIDKDTTGLLVVAKNDRAHLSLAEQLKDRSLSRTYYALVHENIKVDSGTIDAPIARSEIDRRRMAVLHKAEKAREAVTDFRVLERFGAYTLVECKLRTGRTHQIRVHMRFIHHPIVGDKTYGVKNEEFNLAGQLLHAGEIGFIHPRTGERVSFTAPLPEDFSRVLDILRKRAAAQ